MKPTYAVLATIGAVLLVGCSKAPEYSVETTMHIVPPPTGIEGPAPVKSSDQTQAGLEATLAEQYLLVQQGDYVGVHRFSSPRYKVAYPEYKFLADIAEVWAGRDFSGPEQYLITMNSPEVATVDIKSHDGKGKMLPSTWTYMNNSWVYDQC